MSMPNQLLYSRIFQTQTLTNGGWPDPTLSEQQKIDLTRPDPGQNFLTWTHH